MKIIQSFAQFDERNFYLKERNFDSNKIYLSFYTFLLSYLTLNKYYGKITMYCNQKAYDSFIKYIPYDDIVIMENKNDINFWNYYKVDVMRRQRTKFIHVDSDVFIFGKIFDEFIYLTKYEAIVQDTLKAEWNPFKVDQPKVIDFLNKKNLLKTDNLEMKTVSCGTVGMTQELKTEYLKISKALKDGFDNKELDVNPLLMSMISEELALYIALVNEKYEYHNILPYDEISKNGHKGVGLKYKYTHMWFGTKYESRYVELIKLRIAKDFPNHIKTIEKYDNEVMSKIKM